MPDLTGFVATIIVVVPVVRRPHSYRRRYRLGGWYDGVLNRHTTMDADRGCVRVAVLASRRFGAVVASEARFEHVTAPKRRGIHFFFVATDLVARCFNTCRRRRRQLE